jgi:hypothetical protein
MELPAGLPKPDAPAKHRRNLIAALAAGGAAALAARAAIAQPGPTPSAGGGSLGLGFSSTTALAGNLGGVDDPTNTSGLGAPAIIRGTVYGHLASGLTVGTGLSQSVQTANATALQNAINYASSAGKFFELIPNTYQIYSSTGLTIGPCNGFVWRGSMYETIIEQFYATTPGAPILTLGDPAFSSSSNGWDFHGVQCIYGASQSGFSSAQAVIVSCQTLSKIGGINLFSNYAPYNGLVFNGGGSLGNFSNIFDNIIIEVVQNSFVVLTGAVGTGNVCDNFYLNNGDDGAGSPTFIAGNYISVSTGSLPTDWEFRRINCEWGGCAALINITGALGFHFGQLHVEGITVGASGGSYNPKLIATTDTSLQIDCLDLVNIFIQSTYATNAALLQDYTGGASVIKINTMTWYNGTAGNITEAFQFYLPAGGGAPDDSLIFNVDNGYMRDASGTNFGGYVEFDNNMPTANFAIPQKFGRYSYGIGGSRVEYAQIPVSATYTHYGQHSWATILVPAAITSFTLTLAHTVGANGTRPTPTGNVVRVHRSSGTASGTLTIKDGAGTTLATNTTSATDYYYYYSGTIYTSFTPEATS